MKRITQRRVPLLPEPQIMPDPNLADLESRLSLQLGTRVRVNLPLKENSRGFINIEYYGTEDLNRVSSLILGE